MERMKLRRTSESDPPYTVGHFPHKLDERRMNFERVARVVLVALWLALGLIAGSHGWGWGWTLFFGFAMGESWMGIWRLRPSRIATSEGENTDG